jgi:hypothetical protein
MAMYLMVMGYQGFHRFRVIIPVILMAQIYLDRNRLRWPPLKIAAVLVLAAVLFLPLKTIGRMAQQGASLEQIADSSSEIIQDAFSGRSELQFLDMFASSLTLTDQAEKFYYGSIYIPLVTLPIPRQIWPEKPGLSDFLFDISTPRRPMGELGMVITFLGECYINFGFIGILILPYISAYLLARAYFYAYRSEYFSVARFGYLLLACNLIQVYRDGFLSIVIFTLVNMTPLCLIVFFHYFKPLALLKPKDARF